MGTNPITMPVIAPDGSTWDIPQEKVADAVKAGGRLAMDMKDPEGKLWAIPMDKVHDAIRAGGMLAPPPVPKPANPIEADLARVNRYPDIIGPNGGPGAPGEYESTMEVAPAEIAKGVGKEVAREALELGDTAATVTSLGLNRVLEPKQITEGREKLHAALQPKNLEQEVGATTTEAGGTAFGAGMTFASLPDFFESLAKVVREARGVPESPMSRLHLTKPITKQEDAAGLLLGAGPQPPLPAISDAVKEAEVKDLLAKVLKKADADTVNTAYEELQQVGRRTVTGKPKPNPTRSFSPVANELKLVKPRVERTVTRLTDQLEDVLDQHPAWIDSDVAASRVEGALKNLHNEVLAGMGNPADAEVIKNVQKWALEAIPKESKMTATELNDLVRLADKQVSNFQSPENLNSAGKLEQEAYRMVRRALRGLVSEQVPQSEKLNRQIHKYIELRDLLRNKYPALQTEPQATLSWQATRRANRAKEMKRIMKYGLPLAAGGYGVHKAVDVLSGNK